MKRLITICAVAVGFILTTTGVATADDVMWPPWVDQDGTVAAGWGDWTGFPGPMPPDWWESNPSVSPDPCAWGATYDSAEFLPDYMGRDDVVKLTGDEDLMFRMPNFFRENPLKKIWIQVTYYQTDPGQYPWFEVTADIVGMSDPFLEDEIDWQDGWVTEAWSFEIWPNPLSEDIELNFAGPDVYPAYVDQVVIDTQCIPEPTTIALLGIGALSLLRRRKNS